MWLFLIPLAVLLVSGLLAFATLSPRASVKLRCGGHWHRECLPDPAMLALTDLVDALDLVDDEVQLTWRDSAGNETC